MITGATRLAGVIGHPVRHSLSPVLHNAAFAAAGLDWAYLAFDVAPGEAGAALAAMRTFGLGGLSVTMPHKTDVAELVDELDPAAAALGSVNTVVVLDDGRLAGHSTDGAGFVASLGEAGVDPAGMRVAIVGAGGAARSVIDALGRAGVEAIRVVNRSPGSAAVAARLGAGRAAVGTTADIASADLVINATSVGMGTGELAFDPGLLHAGQVVADLVYHPIDTELLVAAAARGARTVDGLGMLLHQAALQQALWTGRTPSVPVMRDAARRALAAPLA